MSSDTLEDLTKGATEGTLEWTKDKIVDAIKRFKEKDLAFIEDIETLDEAKKQRKKAEWEIFSNHIEDKDLRVQFQLGLTLRHYETEGKELKPLKDKIKAKYNSIGLHRAYFVQNGLFSKYIGSILDETEGKELKHKIRELFEDIDLRTQFITNKESTGEIVKEVSIQIMANKPEAYIISSAGSAKEKCEEVKDKVMEEITSEYKAESYEEYGGEGKKIYIISRTNQAQN